MNRRSICLVMIARNERSLIADALRSVRAFVSDMLVVDTGSTDDTPAIARHLGARVAHVAWNDDFSAARNTGLALASGDWVLSMDADERFVARASRLLPKALEQRNVLGYALEIDNVRLDGTLLARQQSTPRLFRRRSDLRFWGRVHEEIRVNGFRGGPFTVLKNGPHLRHYGYDVGLIVARGKDERNVRLLDLQLADNPLDQRTNYLITRQHCAAGRLEEAERWLQRTLSLDPEMEELAPLEQQYLRDLPAWLVAPGRGQEVRV